MTAFHIRVAQRSDLHSIQDIYHQHVLGGYATWNSTEFSTEHFQHLFDHLKKNGFPLFVVEQQQTRTVVGYADYAGFRNIQGFHQTVELSIFLRQGYSGLGLGSKLLAMLIEHAKANNKHVMVAAIDSENKASIELHKKFGFIQAGYMPQVGQKFGHWRNLVLMQFILNEAKSNT